MNSLELKPSEHGLVKNGGADCTFLDRGLVTKRFEKEVVPKVVEALEEGAYPVTKLGLNRLSGWMAWLECGSYADIRTNIYDSMSRGAILRDFDALFTKFMADQPDSDYWDVLKEVEIGNDGKGGQRAKMGPMSPYLPFSRDGMDKVLAVFSDKPLSSAVNRVAYKSALTFIARLVPRASLHRIPVVKAIHGDSADASGGLDGTTNSCAPFWMKNWTQVNNKDGVVDKVRQSSLNWYLDDASKWINKMSSSVLSYAALPLFIATAGQRTVQRGPEPFDPKSKRIVDALTKRETICGKIVVQPATEALKEVFCPGGCRMMAAWRSKDIVDVNAQHMLAEANASGRIVLSGDISSFDATVPPQVLHDVLCAMAEWFSDPEDRRLIYNIAEALVYKVSIVTPTGYVSQRPSSMKSGSILTSIGGSLVNLFIQKYGEFSGYFGKMYNYMVLGDDFVTDADGLTPEGMSQAFDDFGMECHPEKQFVHDGQLNFLQLTHYLGLPGGRYPIYRCLASCTSLENRDTIPWHDDNQFSRDVQILAKVNNAVFHPMFTQFVEYIARGSPNGLGADYDPAYVLRRAGSWAESELTKMQQQPWRQLSDTGTTRGDNPTSFVNWPVNGVLRGEKLPPLGKELWKRVYGKSFDQMKL